MDVRGDVIDDDDEDDATTTTTGVVVFSDERNVEKTCDRANGVRGARVGAWVGVGGWAWACVGGGFLGGDSRFRHGGVMCEIYP